MTKSDKRQREEQPSDRVGAAPPKKRRGRPEKMFKIDDTPENVVRSFFKIPSDKFTRPKS